MVIGSACRRRLMGGCGALALVACVLALHSGGPGAAQQGARRDMPQLRVHEWGVWIVERQRISLDALAAEAPPFVVRARESAPPTPPPSMQAIPVPPEHRPTVRKPVIFFYAGAPMDVRVEVAFRGGEPWLLYPQASEARGNRLMWRGRVGAAGTPPPVDPDHWWQDLRDVGAQGFATDRGGFERFLFYDGVARFEAPFRFSPVTGVPEPRVTPTPRAEGPLFIVSSRGLVEHDRRDGAWVEVHRGAAAEVRARLRPALLGRGLSAAEADALLDVWSDELVGAGRGAHAVYFISRAAYDRMLPIRITPRPDELVRVGLVIERF